MQSLSNFSVLIDKDDIQLKVTELASKIDSILQGKDIVLVGILKGAVYFMVDLSRAMKTDHSIYFIEASSYKGETQHEVDVHSPIEPSKFEGKIVVLVDELWDSGKTMTTIAREIHERAGVPIGYIVTVTMFCKEGTSEPCLYGFKVPKGRWLIGYGLDNDSKMRNLRDLLVKD
jgi:hypoxanthine phosphoribosyltransferase